LTNQGKELEDIDSIPGFAFELGMATTQSTVGLSLGIMGNLNSESNLYGFFLSLTLGNHR
jgi:Trk-type K+ transport system membrane component